MEETRTPKSLADLFAGYSGSVLEGKKKRTSERSELVRFFFEKTAPSWKGKKPLTAAYVGFRLAHLSKDDLYAFKSMALDRERKGYPVAKFVWGALKEQSWQKAGY